MQLFFFFNLYWLEQVGRCSGAGWCVSDQLYSSLRSLQMLHKEIVWIHPVAEHQALLDSWEKIKFSVSELCMKSLEHLAWALLNPLTHLISLITHEQKPDQSSLDVLAFSHSSPAVVAEDDCTSLDSGTHFLHSWISVVLNKQNVT